MNQEIEFVKLNAHENYEISTAPPFIIRRNGKILSQSINNAGYVQVSLDGITTPLHRVIAEQFIPNPDNLSDVNHKSQNKLDNRIENLEWTSHDENLKRRSKFSHQTAEYLDFLEGMNIVPLTDYNGATFDRYFFDRDNEKLYLKTRAKRCKDGTDNFHYKLIKPCFHNNLGIIALITSGGKSKSCGYKKLIRYLHNF